MSLQQKIRRWGQAGRAAACAAGVWCAFGVAGAQGSAIWRCGNEYTNHPGPNPAARGCREILGGQLTIVEGARPARGATGAPAKAAGAAPAVATNGARSAAERVEPDQQRQRDAEARRILEQELRRAEERLTQAQKEYAEAQSPQQTSERSDPARQTARMAELRTRIERAEADVAAIRREIGRLDGAR
ncbi:MAG: hypothetical protein P3W97_006940 [Tepidimonas sp.]|uniref:hypothetical protein n=1 Tax=Tepidimonas sp. TaxID=2002775 RepID=UPI00259F81F1|nr:hypothetical protein [Tepidimonas sp.]MDM7456977.1 hypothetical protein [Tepidimonas sp.]